MASAVLDKSETHRFDAHPPLMRDPSFWGMTVTQFLGAFNDNLYKQLTLLICLDLVSDSGADNYQGMASIIFAAPFILFSGFAGFLADRNSKRNIVVLAKVAEILVMVMGAIALSQMKIVPIFMALFLMSVQSAFFGPPKYGILPELFRGRDLPRANGIFLMTTFLAIILGFAAAGSVKHLAGDRLWLSSATCVLVAIVGTLTSLIIRKTPIARPDLKFEISALAIPTETRKLLFKDRDLLGVLLASSIFWLIGGVVYPPAVNALGKIQMQLNDQMTSFMAASTGIGIALGCVLAGKLSQGQVNFGLVRLGSWGIIACMVLLAMPGPMTGKTLLGPYGATGALVFLGMFAGFFSVPLQVFLQAKAPDGQKGRIIAAMNLLNWIGICLAGAIYWICDSTIVALGLPKNATFGLCALFMLPIALFYRPKNHVLS